MQMENELLIKTLKNTGLFETPESDLRDLFALKTSGREAFLLSCYGNTSCRCYYLYSDEILITPCKEEGLLTIPQAPLGFVRIEDIPEVFSSLPALDLMKKDRKLLDKVLKEDKYIVFKNSRKCEYCSERTKRQYYRRYREEILDLRREAVKRGIDPLNVLVVDGKLSLEHEGFLTPYLAGVKLRERKYLVSGTSLGIAGGDLFAYRAEDFGSGAFLAGLIVGIEEIEKGTSEPSTCIIEDEAQVRVCDSHHGINQVAGYLLGSREYFRKGFVTAPLMAEYQIKEAEKRGVGVITFNEEGEIIFVDGKEMSSERQSEIINEVKNLAYLAREYFNFLLQKL